MSNPMFKIEALIWVSFWRTLKFQPLSWEASSNPRRQSGILGSTYPAPHLDDSRSLLSLILYLLVRLLIHILRHLGFDCFSLNLSLLTIIWMHTISFSILWFPIHFSLSISKSIFFTNCSILYSHWLHYYQPSNSYFHNYDSLVFPHNLNLCY